MQTNLADFVKKNQNSTEAEAILRSCVHCGFCLATCPTYQLLGDELDSPRGRIYLMKQVLEGHTVTQKPSYIWIAASRAVLVKQLALLAFVIATY